MPKESQENNCPWEYPSDRLVLAPGDVHVWYASLDLPFAVLERLSTTLSDDEQKRAQRFVFATDRQHFIAARGILRNILSHYMQVSARELEFGYGEQGKPYLTSQQNGLSLQFNLSHSNGIALYAVTLDSIVGIDVECVRKEVDVFGIAKRFFSSKEFQALSNLPLQLQERKFFCYWALKEAVIKALGSGLLLSLDQFEVSCLQDEFPMLLEIQGSVEKAADWVLCSLNLHALALKRDYVAALAILGKINSLQCWRWQVTLDW
jgi:4'-phosphopantetheinyl transferase